MKRALGKVRQFAASASKSVRDAAAKTTDAVKRHAPSAEQWNEAKELVVDTAKTAAGHVQDLVNEIVESKPFRDGAKGALVGATVAVPLPLVGPLFGGAVGAVIAVYFGQQGKNGSDKVLVPAEGSELYIRLLELDDLRKRKTLTREQFEEQVREVLRSCSSTQPKQPNEAGPATDAVKKAYARFGRRFVRREFGRFGSDSRDGKTPYESSAYKQFYRTNLD